MRLIHFVPHNLMSNIQLTSRAEWADKNFLDVCI